MFRRPIAISRSTAAPDSSTTAPTITSTRSTRHRQARLGNVHPRLPARAQQTLGPDHRERQADLRARLRARRRSRGLRDHGARRRDRQGALAQAHDPEARRAGRRNAGATSRRRALARRLVDGAELRSRAEPHLRRHVGHLARAEVHARRQRQAAPLPQLDAGAATPTRARSSGTTSMWSITGTSTIRSSASRRYGGRAGSRRSAVDQPARAPGRAAQGHHRHSRQDGLVYTLDRETGEFLWARADDRAERDRHIDGETGAVTSTPTSCSRRPAEEASSARATNGGKNWPAGAYSPLTKVMYFPLQNTCMTATAQIDKPDAHVIVRLRYAEPDYDGDADKVGTIYAISAETGKPIWKYEQRAATQSLVATGGRLLFGGDAQGRFRAFDQDTGKVLWEVIWGRRSPDIRSGTQLTGRQYIAVSTGGSLATGGYKRFDPRTPCSGTANNLFVFALPTTRRQSQEGEPRERLRAGSHVYR